MLYILIPIHNNIKETMKCLECIKNQTYTDYEVVIINDGSEDDSSFEIRQKYPDAIILEGDGNMWWAGALYAGINFVLKHANTFDYVLFLNNDLIFDDDYLEILVKGADINPDSAIGSLCKDQKTNLLVDSGVTINWPKLKFTHKEVKNDDNNFINDIDVLSTRGLIVPIYIINDVGNFIPKRIRHYLSDYEYTIRIKGSGGWKLLTAKNAVVYLDVEQTGIHTKWSSKQTFKSIFDTLFSLRSSSNLKSWLWFIHTSCPSRYKARCYWKITGGKVIEIIISKIT